MTEYTHGPDDLEHRPADWQYDDFGYTDDLADPNLAGPDRGYTDHPDYGAGGPAGSVRPAVGGGRRPPQRRQRRRSRHPVLRALAIVVAVVVVLAVIAGFWVDRQIDPGGKPGPAVSVVIPKGSSSSDIGKLLAKAGVIHDGTIFPYYARIHGSGALYPGTYSLDKNSSYGTVLDALRAGPPIVDDHLVIPEGYTVDQIAVAVGALKGIGISASQFLAAAKSGVVRSPYQPAGSDNLEGLLFPATYDVSPGDTATSVLQEMVGAFDQRAQQIGLPSAAATLGMTPYQVVTVASIVERESKLEVDRGPVASAIYNRLKIGMTLGADSTQTYYLRLTDPTMQPTAAQLDQPSPYNTRLNKGLPPTPIANPGLPSLEAAASPPKTDYLYYVEINPDGKLGYASTDSGFESLQQQCHAAGLC